jgi:ArsR family transcriptional regulator, arsenate/arsenite/antimonite-responsive transcriptional repressor
VPKAKAAAPVGMIHTACCAPGADGADGATSGALDRPAAEAQAQLLKAVADPTRLQLIAMLRAAPSGEVCVCDLTAPLGLSQPTVSHHLKVLADAGLVTRERRGTWAWYALVPDRMAEIGSVFGP